MLVKKEMTVENTKKILLKEENQKLKNFEIAIDENVNIYRRIDSIALIEDRDLLIKLYKECNNLYIKKEIIVTSRLEEIYELALKEKEMALRLEAIKAIHNKMKLREEAENDDNYLVRIAAVKKISDPHVLQKIIIYDDQTEVKKTALNQIKSISLLEALKEYASSDTVKYIDDRINVITGSEDYLKKSIEKMITTYSEGM